MAYRYYLEVDEDGMFTEGALRQLLSLALTDHDWKPEDVEILWGPAWYGDWDCYAADLKDKATGQVWQLTWAPLNGDLHRVPPEEVAPEGGLSGTGQWVKSN